MTIAQLGKVEELKVWNEHGSVEFLGQTDVVGVDLSDVITIKRGSVEVYDETRHGLNYPAVGQKLNRPATIILNNIRPKRGQSGSEKEEQLRRCLKERGAEHLSYDEQRGTWEFKV